MTIAALLLLHRIEGGGGAGIWHPSLCLFRTMARRLLEGGLSPRALAKALAATAFGRCTMLQPPAVAKAGGASENKKSQPLLFLGSNVCKVHVTTNGRKSPCNCQLEARGG